MPNLKLTCPTFCIEQITLDCVIIREVMGTTWGQSVHAQESLDYLFVVQWAGTLNTIGTAGLWDFLLFSGLRASDLPCLRSPLATAYDAYWQLHIQLLLIETSSFAIQTVLWGTDLPSWKWEYLVFRPAKELPGLWISDPGSCGQGQRSLPTSGTWLPTSSTWPWTAPSK